ncbi:MAG: HAMP domain-containing protein, partial [Armatimonadetes bacterium]|nr:HAMP domain-containing protein [Armatimonadota bacterium]
MKLRLKTPLVLASLVLLVLTASIWSAVKTHRDAQVHSSRSRTQERAAFAVNALRLTIADFHARWAGWAMLPESDAEARVPIQVASLQGVAPRLGVHLLVVEDRQGRMIWGSGIQPGSPRPTPVPRAVRQWLTSDPMTMTRARGRRSVSGLLVVGGTPLIVSAHLLRTPGKRGAVRGRLVVGRWLDERELNRIREVADAPLELFALGAEDFPDDVQRSLASLRQLEVPHVAVEPGEPSRGYVLLGDVTDRRALVLRVTPEAAAYPGQPDLGVRIAGLVGVVLGLGLLMAFWLDRSVFQRLEKLASALQDAGQPGRSAPPAAIRGHDELGEAARALERLVQRNGAEQDWWEQRETALQAALKKASDQGRRTASLLAEMARELRGPVNAIVGASEGLDAAEPGVLSAAQKRWITEVLVNSRRLLQLANDSADLSASSAASVPAALRPAEIVHETVGAVAALAERMGVAITLDVSQAPPE